MIFSFSELWGPFTCEAAGCAETAWEAFLTDEEEALLPTDEHPSRTLFIIEKGIGMMLCDRHLPQGG